MTLSPFFKVVSFLSFERLRVGALAVKSFGAVRRAPNDLIINCICEDRCTRVDALACTHSSV